MITYTTNEYGFRKKDIDYMLNLFESMLAVEKVALYGSRALGNFEKGSDVDLAIIGEQVSFGDIAHIHYLLENESPTLLWFDVLHYNSLKNTKLKEQIDSHGKIIYERKK